MTLGFIILCQQAVNTDRYLFGVISYNTLFTVITTIFVFFLGVLFQKRLERYKRRIYLKSIKDNFLYLVRVLPDRYITPHIEQLRNFYLDSNIDTGVTVTPPITISGDLKRISEFSSNELFTAFRTLTKNDFEKDLHNILSQIDYLIEQTNIIDKYHNAILLRNNELRNEIQNHIEEYLDLIANSIRDIKRLDENYEKNPFWVFINKMLLDYYKDPNRNNTISYLYKYLLRPMQVELVSKGYDRQIKEAEQITLLGKKITTRRFYLRHQTVSIRLQYRQFFNETSSLLIDFSRFSNNLVTLKYSKMESKFMKFVNENKWFIVFFLVWVFIHMILLIKGNDGNDFWPFDGIKWVSDYGFLEFFVYITLPLLIFVINKLVGKDMVISR